MCYVGYSSCLGLSVCLSADLGQMYHNNIYIQILILQIQILKIKILFFVFQLNTMLFPSYTCSFMHSHRLSIPFIILKRVSLIYSRRLHRPRFYLDYPISALSSIILDSSCDELFANGYQLYYKSHLCN